MFKDKKKIIKWIIILGVYAVLFAFSFSMMNKNLSMINRILSAAILPIIIIWPIVKALALPMAIMSLKKKDTNTQNGYANGVPMNYQPMNYNWNNPANQSTWICSCGKVNYPETSVCVSCGQQRSMSPNMGYNTIPNNGVTDYAPQLANLKSLYDQGLITEEEYTAKKKQILGL